jgi:hypothetical protein
MNASKQRHQGETSKGLSDGWMERGWVGGETALQEEYQRVYSFLLDSFIHLSEPTIVRTRTS